jgi:uncharacterized protein Veg
MRILGVILLVDSLSAIRETVSRYRGSRVFYKAANGRRKAEARQGVILEAYPSLFTLFVESQNSTVSFSYADILTREVELRLLPLEEDKA